MFQKYMLSTELFVRYKSGDGADSTIAKSYVIFVVRYIPFSVIANAEHEKCIILTRNLEFCRL